MIRACGVATAVGGLFIKVLVGLVGLAVVAAFVPSPAADPGPRSERVGPALSEETVTLRIPEGEPAGHLTVVDESGRPLAVVTRLRNGMASVVATRGGDVAVGCFFTAEGAACLELIGAVRQASIDFTPDGDLRVAQTVRGGRLHPASAPGVGARMGPRPSAGE